ncbi:MAG TPA: hypothetical protein VF794_25260 [Archangium sp.]|jgi:hypothetical protein|uniref:hypothetical protein n=1 Tax=Archangium sp. TaxID=1872627 RepID=UPI002EDA6051
MRLSFRLVLTLLLPLALAACPNPPPEKPAEYALGGTVTGLAGTGLVLENNGETLAITENASFTFARKVASGAAYDVKINTHPSDPTQECTVANGTGTMGGADMADVAVTCTTRAFKVGGTVTGLTAGRTLRLQNNGGDTLTVNANGAFQFATAVKSGLTFAVTVSSQPTSPSQTCTVSGGTGTMGGADVSSVTVNCATNSFTLGGNVTGLKGTLVLTSGTQEVTVTSNGTFAFPQTLLSGTAYEVLVKTEPDIQDCTITRGKSTVGNGNVTGVLVTCVTHAYSVKVDVTGLVGTLVLQNNGGNDLTVTANGISTFSAKVNQEASYFVTIGQQPTIQTCTVAQKAALPMGGADVTVAVSCVTNTFTLGGTVSGLADGESVELANGTDTVTPTANGEFTFPNKVNQGSGYEVVVKTRPPGKVCSVGNGKAVMGPANVTNVTVTCSANTFSVSGTLDGLGAGGTLKVVNNGGDERTLVEDGPFTFPVEVAEGGTYAVTVSAQPAGQRCTVKNGSGTNLMADVTNVEITCVPLYTLGGTVTGLESGKSLVLTNNGGDDLTVNGVAGGSASFTFATGLAGGETYAVAVKTPAEEMICTVDEATASGTIATAKVTNVAVTCKPKPALLVSVLRAGDGSAALSSAAAAIFIETYDLRKNVLVGTKAITGLTVAGSSGSEGYVSRSTDGRYVVFAGYSAAAGTAAVAATTASATPRVVGRLDGSGNFVVAATLNTAFSASNVRSATTVDGSGYWVAGNGGGTPTTGGIHYVVHNSTGESTQILTTPNNSRVAVVSGGQLYLSTGSGTSKPIFAVGTGLPTATGQTATGLNGVSTFNSPYGFVFLDRNPAVDGDDTLYVADDASATATPPGGIFKYVKDSTGKWTAAPLTSPGPARGVAVLVDGSTVHVVATTSETTNKLITFVDDGTTTATVTTVSTAATNTAFRGVALAPLP